MQCLDLSEGGGTRTHDLGIKSPLLYQLSYAPVRWNIGPPNVLDKPGTGRPPVLAWARSKAGPFTLRAELLRGGGFFCRRR